MHAMVPPAAISPTVSPLGYFCSSISGPMILPIAAALATPDPGSGNDLMVSYGRLNERSKKAVDDLVALLLDLQEKSKE